MKTVKMTTCTLVFSSFRTRRLSHVMEEKGNRREPQEKTRRGKNTKSGESDREFWGFCRPKKTWRRSRPAAQVAVPGVFSTAQQRVSEMPNQGEEPCR